MTERMTAAEYNARKKPKRNKYGARKTVVDGIRFDSKGEADRYGVLKQRQDAGLITLLECQPVYPINLNEQHVCTYKADFRYLDTGTQELVVEDFKGRDTPMSRLKRKLVKAVYGVSVRIVKNQKE